MAKYRIGWMPGDGVGVDVMDATRIVLDALGFDADYIPGDIGWEIWCREGERAARPHARDAPRRGRLRSSAPSPASRRKRPRPS
jgi:isocitrate/isopropylmalate dehydrogenase